LVGKIRLAGFSRSKPGSTYHKHSQLTHVAEASSAGRAECLGFNNYSWD
jgi:hypothetical protein